MRLSLWSACLLSASAAASDAKLALDGLDPVELIQGQKAKGQPQYSAERGDFRYWFKSEENRSKFASDPEKYGLQLGGKCELSDQMPGTQRLHTRKLSATSGTSTTARSSLPLGCPRESMALYTWSTRCKALGLPKPLRWEWNTTGTPNPPTRVPLSRTSRFASSGGPFPERRRRAF